MADSYNKQTKTGAGTLVENWFEERELREQTGWSRNYPMEHVPKTKEGPVFTRDRAGTEVRVLGQGDYEKITSFNREYGRSKDATAGLRKTGIREQALIDSIRREVTDEMAAKQREVEQERERRYLDSTTRTAHDWKTRDEPVGKRVMKTQDGQPTDGPDEVFEVEHGRARPRMRKTREELEEEVRAANVPITLYSDNLSKEFFMISAAKGPNPFAKTSGFTQPLNYTRAAANYQGNTRYNDTQYN